MWKPRSTTVKRNDSPPHRFTTACSYCSCLLSVHHSVDDLTWLWLNLVMLVLDSLSTADIVNRQTTASYKTYALQHTTGATCLSHHWIMKTVMDRYCFLLDTIHHHITSHLKHSLIQILARSDFSSVYGNYLICAQNNLQTKSKIDRDGETSDRHICHIHFHAVTDVQSTTD